MLVLVLATAEAMMRDLLLLATAGALGTLSRYGVVLWSRKVLGPDLPGGTLLVNVLGCFVLAFLMQLGLSGEAIPRSARLIVGVGFLGAFTTFSTFGYETLHLLERGALGPALLNVSANVVLGLLAAWGGLMAGRAMLAPA